MGGRGDVAVRAGCKLLALLFLFVVTLALAHNLKQAYEVDFASFWAAAVLALEGSPADAYDIAAHSAVQGRAVAADGGLPFAYPPPFLIPLMPFGLLPYAAAAALWVVMSFAFYAAAARRLMPHSLWIVAAFPPVLVNGIIGQSGFATAGILILGLLALPRRPFVAGLICGCLVIKPHLGLLLPLAFVAARQWRAFVGAALSSTGLLLAGLLLFGSESYAAWQAQGTLFVSIVSDGLVGWHKMASVYASLRLAGAPASVAWTLHATIAVTAAGLMWRVWRGDASWPAKGAALAAATALASPYLYVYDTLILILPFLWLIGVGRHRVLLALLWCVPLVSFLQTWGWNGSVNLMPIVPITLLLLIARHALQAPAGNPASAGVTTGCPPAPALSSAPVSGQATA